MKGLYIHIPFCNKVCPYCDFYKMVIRSEDTKKRYVSCLLKEASLKRLDKEDINTIYIGGGTPSTLSLQNLEVLLNGIHKIVNINNISEFTIECNVEDINEQLLSLFKKYNVNRLSVGIQTRNKTYLKLINRSIDSNEFNLKMNLINKYFSNYSFDLIYGFYNQTICEVLDDVKQLLLYKPTHISVYPLMIEEHTMFSFDENHNIKRAASDDIQSQMYEEISNYLEQHNYNNYETSNFCINGNESIHNLIYWHGEDYFSLGASASSFIKDTRYKTISNINKYMDNVDNNIVLYESEKLSKNELIEEYVMLNLRLAKGLNLNFLECKFNLRSYEDIFVDLHDYFTNKVLEIKDGYLYITKQYRFMALDIVSRILT